MSRRVTLELPDEVLDRAERLAVLTHRDVRQLLAEAVSAMLPPLDVEPTEGRPMTELSDAEVLRLAALRLSPRQERRLSQLLDRAAGGAAVQSPAGRIVGADAGLRGPVAAAGRSAGRGRPERIAGAARSVSDSIPVAVKPRVRQQAEHRCGYCRSRQEYVLGFLEIEHIVPRARGGTDDEQNLWLACRLCNHYKAAQTRGRDPLTGRRVRLFNPRKQRWSRHFRWSSDGLSILGRTACGTATVPALKPIPRSSPP